MAAQRDALGQKYNTAESVVWEKGSDVIIVGRGIYEVVDPAVAAKEFRDAGWTAYLKRLGQCDLKKCRESLQALSHAHSTSVFEQVHFVGLNENGMCFRNCEFSIIGNRRASP